jgi:acyl dehydratase
VRTSRKLELLMTITEPQTSQAKLYLEDLKVGQRFTSRSHLVDEAQITAFARTYDPQPFHLDNESARHTLFGGLAASGWHTAAITMRLMVESGLPLAGGIIGAGGQISWPQPTRPGDILTVTSAPDRAASRVTRAYLRITNVGFMLARSR